MFLKKLSLTHLIFAGFVLIHLVLFNVNVAEWGDSYRILRAAEFIRDFSYPEDEKRPPLFSAVLAVRPERVDPVFWGRVVMFGISLLSFIVFAGICGLFFKDDLKFKNLALLFFVLNPVYLYWSLRIMADCFFALIVLSTVYLYTRQKSKLHIRDVVILGFLSGLAVLTRFEGYLLFGALGLGILFTTDITPPSIISRLKNNFWQLFSYTLAFVSTVLPYLWYRNPFTSSYLAEPSGRIYDFRMILIYLVSLIFMFGFCFTGYFFVVEGKKVWEFFKGNLVISTFVVAELILILFWPAAIPRLFVPIIPFLILGLVVGISSDWGVLQCPRTTCAPFKLGIGLLSLFLFAFAQYFFRLQFLVPIRSVFILVVLVQLVIFGAILWGKWKLFVGALIVSMVLWSFSAIWVHKDIFAAVQAAALYASENLHGVIGYNDVSSVSDWYLNQKGVNGVSGMYFPYGKKEQLDYDYLKEKGFDYLLLTNEHNTDTTLDIEKRPWLTEIVEFNRAINGKVFWTKVVRVGE